MIFEEIRIRNLFSYYGEQVLTFPAPSPEKPVILISGRNGFGKTSFINSIKLFFLGTGDAMLRGIQAGRTLRPTTYLLGVDKEWQGVFNRQARQEPGADYSITVVWREEEGRVTATRGWAWNGGEPDAYLHIEPDFRTDLGPANRPITDIDACEEFLERRLPKSVVPFFFYDGEQVQALAEANRAGQMRQIEKLLDIEAIETLGTYLQKVIAEWRSEGAAATAQAELEALRAQVQQQNAEYARHEAERDDFIADIENLEREIRKNERQVDAIRALSKQRDAPKLKEKVGEFGRRLEEACIHLAERLPIAAPLWANPTLVARVGTALQEATGNANHLLAQEMQDILQRLPSRLLDEAPHAKPPLSDSQKEHYRKKIGNIFSQYIDTPGSGFFSLPPAAAVELKRRFDYFSQATGERRRLADDLVQISLLRRQIQDAQNELDAVDDISPEEQRDFRERQQAIADARQARDALLLQKGGAVSGLEGAINEVAKLEQKIRAKEVELVKKGITSQRIERARKAQQVFDHYKQRLKETRREQIEAAINKRFKELMSSHGLIDRIEVDADFALTYLDSAGNPVGMANISSGMKQLAAQTLLWALSEAAARKVPIIVDTPLARIDRLNQENLLINFYPKAGEQVIVLPTDSELDQEKYQILLPHICAEFQLANPSGERTVVRSGVPMYPVARAGKGARRGQ